MQFINSTSHAVNKLVNNTQQEGEKLWNETTADGSTLLNDFTFGFEVIKYTAIGIGTLLIIVVIGWGIYKIVMCRLKIRHEQRVDLIEASSLHTNSVHTNSSQSVHLLSTL